MFPGFSGVPAARHTAGFSKPMVIVDIFCRPSAYLGPQLERQQLHTPLLKPSPPATRWLPRVPLAVGGFYDCPARVSLPCQVAVGHPGPFATASARLRPASSPSLLCDAGRCPQDVPWPWGGSRPDSRWLGLPPPAPPHHRTRMGPGGCAKAPDGSSVGGLLPQRTSDV